MCLAEGRVWQAPPLALEAPPELGYQVRHGAASDRVGLGAFVLVHLPDAAVAVRAGVCLAVGGSDLG